ncbi:ADP-heptose--lipooligosaccharide heptosyltransferase 2 [Desulfurella amilsii]|uniref:lipopolysaccharide heptosyltransferase II n=1 Tax=Desulfurella amilsii TaxID=1562698 RepID=A0A1X4XZT6_9BACT|nr:lipopolysaccharide heptosyltransferase II [Desulfurella amilsii]OSS43024.1 ADP-heptose--lipooligosaccharide heptosyltransferase 2 [Desulfurella amilsii]
MKKFLFIQTAFLGDAILSVPIIDSLKNKYKDASITVLTTPQNKEVYTLNSNIGEIILYDKHGLENNVFSMIKKIKLLKGFGFDCVITNHPSARTALISYFSAAKLRIAPSSVSLRFLYTNTINVEVESCPHQIDKNLALLKLLDFEDRDFIRKINLFFLKEDEKLINGVLEACSVNDNKKIVVINPLSAWSTKRWPKEYYKELALMLEQNGYLVLLIGTQKDINIGEYIKSNKKNIVNLMGQTNIKELFAVISKANLLISNDSAPVHIASAYNIPTIEIYGPTSPEFGFYPLSEKNAIFEIKDLDCRPCGSHGSNSCKKSHFECMMRIRPQEVFKTAIEFL